MNGSLLAGSASTSWSTMSLNFNASSTNSTLVFLILATNQDGWLLDNFSVQDSNGTEALTNGNFDTGNITNGWLSNRCTGVTCGAITNSGCYGGSTGCFEVSCNTVHAIQQTFPTIPSNTYTFSFKVKVLGSTSSSISLSYSIT